MGEIIIPQNFRQSGTPFLDLTKDPKVGHYLFKRVTQIVSNSFREDAHREGKNVSQLKITQSEVKRRADIVGNWYRAMTEMGLSSPNTIEHLARALRVELDGGTFTPPTPGKMWASEDEQ